MAPGDWRALIHRHLDSLGPQALLDGLKSSGWQLTYTAARRIPTSRRAQKRTKNLHREWSIGMIIDDKRYDRGHRRGSRRRARRRRPGHDQLIAVNGRKYSVEVLDAAIAGGAGEQASRSSSWWRTATTTASLSVPYFDGPRWPHLTRIDGSPDVLAEVLKPRSN